MALVALVYAHHVASGAEPIAAIDVTGITSVHRQIRQCRRAGAARIVVMVERVGPALAAGLERARKEGAIEVVHGAPGVIGAIGDEDDVLSIDEGLVADDRILSAIVSAEGRAVIGTWPDGERRPESAERIAADRFFAGVARFRGDLVRIVAGRLGDWDLQATLLRAALGERSAMLVDVSGIEEYCADRRRIVPLQWVRAVDSASAHAAGREALAAAQKGVLDWPARFLHPPIENALTRLVLATAISPNMISVGVFLLGLVAIGCFAMGQLWAGLIIALVVGPLDGVDGKLARTRVEFSKYGDLEHVADKIVEYGCFFALAWHFDRAGSGGAWALSVFIVLFALAEAIQGEFFRHFVGRQLDDAGDFERRFRLVSGRRNTFFWTLVPFGLLDSWYGGYIAIAIYSAGTFFVMQARFFKRMRDYGSECSDRIAANFAKTAYDFLPQGKRSGK
jgi:phosphatidylglycerophosphate synthase